MYQSGRAVDEAKKRKSPAKSRRVGISDSGLQYHIQWMFTKYCKNESECDLVCLSADHVKGGAYFSYCMYILRILGWSMRLWFPKDGAY